MSSSSELIISELKKLSNHNKEQVFVRFFKTGPGEYGEGDKFYGISVPQCRKIAKKHTSISLQDTHDLLLSGIHECRFVALLILVDQYKRGDLLQKEDIYKFYLQSIHRINNWDLVDVSAYKIIGPHVYNHPDESNIRKNLATSENIWSRRIAIISTFYNICQKNPDQTLFVSKILLHDEEDLIHKAVGWMLREVGKRCSVSVLEQFLSSNYQTMPRTMLRYSIERLPQKQRQKYLHGTI